VRDGREKGRRARRKSRGAEEGRGSL